MESISEWGLVITLALLAISEALGMIPNIKQHSIFQVIVTGLVWLKDLFAKMKAQPPQG